MLDDEKVISEWVTRLQGARKRLEGIGEVNLVAVDEYTEVKGRFDQLETQRLDLEESVKAIQHSIAQLNRTCRERFRETFDRVNTLFKEGYPLLVGGGQARLVLTDEEDMLETGVDIEVQPPGKRLQNVTLLSGGETAMAAIALIFALFRVKPSPFCLLDEVDAPLDEANGARFNGLLREMSKLSQFIVITHNKKTMECVDTLYGVTMEQPGVSQLVTVKLD
jgi:chromosome segregation protein